MNLEPIPSAPVPDEGLTLTQAQVLLLLVRDLNVCIKFPR